MFNLRIAFPILVICLLLTTTAAHARSPYAQCHGVDRHVPQHITALEPILAPQINQKLREGLSADITPPDITQIKILKSFRYHGWSIFYASTMKTDEVYIFLSGDPMTSPVITLFAGSAPADEFDQIVSWAQTNAPGIPDRLAKCFAGFVTGY